MENHDIKFGSLNSGWKYLCVKTNSKRKASVQIRVNVGSRDEDSSIKGISHLLEHMFFQGSKKYPTSKKLEQEIYRCGGRFNAYTDYDETVFHTEASVDCLEGIVKIMADAYYHSNFSEKCFRNEKQVVINELNDYYSNTEEVVLQGLFKTAFSGSRFDGDTGGSPKTVSSLTISDLKNFVNTYYSRDVILTICGDISFDPCQRLLDRYFSKGGAHYPVRENTEICNDRQRILYPDLPFMQTQMRIHYIPSKQEQCFVAIGFPSYAYNQTEKAYQMLAIQEILTGYMNSVLYTVLRQQNGLIYHVGSTNRYFDDFGYFTIRCTTQNSKRKLRKCVHLILETVCTLCDKLTPTQLRNSKQHLINSIIIDREDPHTVGLEYSHQLHYCDEITPVVKKIKIIEGITISDIRSVMRTVFLPEKATICYSGKQVFL